MFLGPHRLADYDDAREPSRVPTAPKPGAVLGAVKDKPIRARLRASLTAPARDASSAAQAGTRKRPPSRTRKQPKPNQEMIDAASSSRAGPSAASDPLRKSTRRRHIMRYKNTTG